MNQKRLWGDPKVRAERQAKAEAFMGRAMELDKPDGLPCGEGCAECQREYMIDKRDDMRKAA